LARPPYLSHTEFGKLKARAERQALQGALVNLIQARFPAASNDIEARIRRVKSVARLYELIRRAATAASPEDLGL
jgi:hypothetical protein